MAESKNDLPAIPESVQYLPVLTQDVNEIKAVLQENMGAANMTAADLDKIKVPSGDQNMWIMQTLNGPKAFEALEGVICMVQMGRSYWISEDVGNNPPDCSSGDTIVGHGRRGEQDVSDGPHDCASCPMNQFGSAIKKGVAQAGKACNERAHLFLLIGEGYLPQVVQVPATSLGAWRKYIARLSSFGKGYSAVVTRMALAPKANKSGTKYLEVMFTSAGVLPPEAAARVKQYASAFGESFKRATRRDDEAAPGGDEHDVPPPFEDNDAPHQED